MRISTAKKGSFVSVILLTMIIAMSVTVILSIKESTLNGVYKAHEICDTPDVFAIYAECDFPDNIIEDVKKDSRVKGVKVADSILTEKAKMGDEEYSNLMFIFRSDENIKLLKEDLSGIAEAAPKLQKGEIYV